MNVHLNDIFISLVAVTGASYTYLVGVDRTDVLLLCDPEDGGSLSVLTWSLQDGMEFFNPINLNSESFYLPDVLTTFSCMRGGNSLKVTQICAKGIFKYCSNTWFRYYFFLVPTISISYGVVPVGNYSSVYPTVNTLTIPSVVQDITLSINIEGKLTLPDNSNSTSSILTILNFSSRNNGVYKFYITNWDDVEVCAIQIELTTSTATMGIFILA